MSRSFNFDALSDEDKQLFLASPAQSTWPEGVVPNSINPDHRSDMVIALVSVFFVLATISVALRAYSQYVVRKLLALENILCFIAYGIYIGLIYIMYALADHKVFWNHQWNLTMQTMSDVLYFLYVLPLCYCIFIGVIKIAILLEWKKIFVPRNVSNSFSWTCNVLIVTAILFHGSFLIALNFLCVPHVKIWQRWVDGTCRERQHFDLSFAVFNLVLDVAILALPQRTIWNLQTSSFKRLGISVVFSVGLLTLLSSVGFVISISMMNYHYDVIHDQGKVLIWLMSECTCAILVFCVPVIPKAFEGTWISTHFSKWLSILLGSGSSSGSGPSNEKKGKGSSGYDSEAQWPGALVTKAYRGSEAGFSQLMLQTTRASTDTETGSQDGLAKIKAAARPSAKNGILMTTEITTEYSSYLPIQGVRHDRTTIQGPRRNQESPWDERTLVETNSL